MKANRRENGLEMSNRRTNPGLASKMQREWEQCLDRTAKIHGDPNGGRQRIVGIWESPTLRGRRWRRGRRGGRGTSVSSRHRGSGGLVAIPFLCPVAAPAEAAAVVPCPAVRLDPAAQVGPPSAAAVAAAATWLDGVPRGPEEEEQAAKTKVPAPLTCLLNVLLCNRDGRCAGAGVRAANLVIARVPKGVSGDGRVHDHGEARGGGRERAKGSIPAALTTRSRRFSYRRPTRSKSNGLSCELPLPV
nr:unnamed protein product [Digitaria exilis]